MKLHSVRHLYLFVIAALLLLTMGLSAQPTSAAPTSPMPKASVLVSGVLDTSDPTFNRPSSISVLSGLGTATHYDAFTFSRTCAGNATLSFETANGGSLSGSGVNPNGAGGGGPDGVMALYNSGGFNPASPLTNIIAFGDDLAINTYRPDITYNFTPGTYTVVLTTYENTPIADFHDAPLPWSYDLAITPDCAPVVSLNQTNFTFGNQPIGTYSAPQTLTITNTGLLNLQISSFGFMGADYILTPYCGSWIIAPGNSCSWDITFHPGSTGPLDTTIYVYSDASTSPDAISVTGSGVAVPMVDLSATNLSFGNQPVGVASASQTVTVTNTGSADLNIGSLGISGDFGLSNDYCSSAIIAPGNSCTFDVIFQPLSNGAKTGTVTIPSDGLNAPNYIDLNGTGGFIPSGTNLLKKFDFSGVNIYPAPWQPVGFRPPYSTVIDCVIFQSGPCSVFFSAGNRAAQQRVNFPGHTGDSFLYGISTASQNAPLAGNYRLDLTFFNSQNRIVGRDTIYFNTGTNPFTIYLDTFTAPANFSYIVYRFTYQKSGGAAWFDDAFLMVAP